MRKKITLTLILALTLCASMTGCGAEKENTPAVSETPDVAATEEAIQLNKTKLDSLMECKQDVILPKGMKIGKTVDYKEQLLMKFIIFCAEKKSIS